MKHMPYRIGERNLLPWVRKLHYVYEIEFETGVEPDPIHVYIPESVFYEICDKYAMCGFDLVVDPEPFVEYDPSVNPYCCYQVFAEKDDFSFPIGSILPCKWV